MPFRSKGRVGVGVCQRGQVVAHLAVGLAERQAAGHQLQRAVGREDPRRERAPQSLRMHPEPRGHQAEHAQRGAGRRHAVHVDLLGLLQVAVVAAGQGLDNGAGGGMVPQHARRLGADQLEHVGIVLLRHDAAAGAELRRQREVAELGHREEDQILGQARGGQHELEQRAEDHRLALAAGVAGVEDVVVRGGEPQQAGGQPAVERQRHPVAGGRTERAAVGIGVGRLDRQQVVEQALGIARGPEADGAGHGRLQVRAPDHRHAEMAPGQGQQRVGQRGALVEHPQQILARMQP